MKSLLITLLLISSSVFADNRYHGHDHGNNNWWMAPAIIGGAAVIYGLNHPHYVPPQPVIPYGYHPETIFDNRCYCYRTVLVPNC